MHEYGLISNVVKNLLDKLETMNISRVYSVELELGEYLFFHEEDVKTCYESLTQGTILEGSQVIIKEKPGRIKCSSCGYVGSVPIPHEENEHIHLEDYPLLCPQCGNIPEIIEGLECAVTKLEAEEKSSNEIESSKTT